MLEEHNRRELSHLFNIIGTRNESSANFGLLMGAGSSASSGVKTSSEMIDDWRWQLYQQSKNKQPFEKWLINQSWYEDDEEYGILFEKVLDQRSQRRIYIEECIKDARPSWGYIYLANIIANNYFNVTFTPNFDDLLNEACCFYADIKPIVCAHDSAVIDVRIASNRRKIIKLHGDFLYDSIKNTIGETESLEKNMREKFMQFSREYGLIVIGYGGNDSSIMDIADMMLRSEGYLPNGLYWCIRNKNKVSKKLARLMRRDNAYWVEINGFDEFMAELHESLGLTLPSMVKDPYRATTERLNSFISPKGSSDHKIIKEDIEELAEQVRSFESIISGKKKAEKDEFDRLVPYEFLGDTESSRHAYGTAIEYYKKALIQKPDDSPTMQSLAYAYYYEGKYPDALNLCNNMIKVNPNFFLGYSLKSRILTYSGGSNKEILSTISKAIRITSARSVIRASALGIRANTYLIMGKWKEALSDSEKALEITPNDKVSILNKCLAMKNLDRGKEARTILKAHLPKIKDPYYRACSFATLGEKVNMLDELKKAIDENSIIRRQAQFDPDFIDFREDQDFKKLIS